MPSKHFSQSSLSQHKTWISSQLQTNNTNKTHGKRSSSLLWALLVWHPLPVQQFIQYSFQQWITSQSRYLCPCLSIKLLKSISGVAERPKPVQQCDTILLYFHVLRPLSQDIWAVAVKTIHKSCCTSQDYAASQPTSQYRIFSHLTVTLSILSFDKGMPLTCQAP